MPLKKKTFSLNVMIFFVDFLVLFLPTFVVFNFSLLAWYIFLCPNSISMSSLHIFTVCERFQFFFILGKGFDVVNSDSDVDFFLWFMKIVPACAFPKYVIQLNLSPPTLISNIQFYMVFSITFLWLRQISCTGWNNKIFVLKKTTLQLFFKTFIEKINSGNLIM